MKNKKGFTLVELLAVIAILAILVIMALPAVLRMFNQARIDTFSNEVNTILRTAKQQYLLEGGNAQTWTNADGSTKKLPLTGNSKLKYYVKMNGNGQITKLQVTNGEYQYSKSGIVEEVIKNDIKVVSDLSEEDKLVIDGSGSTATAYVYYTGTSEKGVGDTITVNNTDTFDNYTDAVSTLGRPLFTAYIVDNNNVIKESYIGFVLNETVYYLKGGDATIDVNTGDLLQVSPSYNSNIQTLDTAFGSSNCQDDTDNYFCSASGLDASAYDYGYVSVIGGGWRCSVSVDSYSHCNDYK